jgi:predicted amidohydrolase
MKIGFAQLNPTVGELSGNFELILRAYERLAAAAGAEWIQRRRKTETVRSGG